jgi:hypothetical protein
MNDLMVQKIAELYGIALIEREFVKPEFVGEDFKSEFIADFPEDQYHTDLTAVARGDLMAFLDSPAHAVARRKKPHEESTATPLRFGRAVHMLLLEPKVFQEKFRLKPAFGDMRSPKAREASAAWLKDQPPGAAILTEEEFITTIQMAKSLAKNPTAIALIQGALCETTAYYRDASTGLKCRVRPDLINKELSALVDLKTTRSAEFRDFQKSAWDYRYDFQLAMYSAGIQAVTGELPEVMAIIAIEKEPPYGCQVFELDFAMKSRGMADYRRALDGFAECLKTDLWPCYTEDAVALTLPRWVIFNG